MHILKVRAVCGLIALPFCLAVADAQQPATSTPPSIADQIPPIKTVMAADLQRFITEISETQRLYETQIADLNKQLADWKKYAEPLYEPTKK
jgi:hypothetical protein